MTKEIKYIGFYDLPNAKRDRVSNLAAVNKMDYIALAINQAGFDVHIISPSWSSGKGEKMMGQKRGTLQINSHKKITFCPTFSTSKKISGYLKIVYSLIWLFFWLVKNVKQDEKILLYHVQWLSLPVRWAKKIKRFHLVLEVEELYGKVWKNKNIFNKWEQKLIESADIYIAVSDVLAEILGQRTKVILYGNYTVPLENKTIFINDDDKIHIVYAGSIDDTKGGALNAARCAGMLPENYKVHILGIGNSKQIKELNKIIDFVNNKQKRDACIYHGVLIGKNYSDFLFKCQIALNPQKEGDYMDTAFPSKVISYLSHNLRVVSTKVKSIENSRLSHFITFSEDDQPSCIVRAIMSINFQCAYNSASEIQKLNNEFVVNIKRLLTDE